MQDIADEPIRTDMKDVRILEELNRQYVCAAETSNVLWFEENLAQDFLASNPDGSLVDRTTFLARVAKPYPGSHLKAISPCIRLVGELALVHAGFEYRKPDGTAGSGRYTDVYTRRNHRWLCVSAHFNRF